jgi:hypothetical protein
VREGDQVATRQVLGELASGAGDPQSEVTNARDP